MSVSRMPRAPMSKSSSISRWAPARGTIARTATQPSRCSGGDGRALDARRERDRVRDVVALDVVVHHHVAAGDQDALEAALEDLEPGRHGAGPGDQHRLGLQDGVAEDLQPRLAQRAAGLDDVGDDVGDAELDAGLDRAVEPGHGGVDAALLEERADDADVRRRDPRAGQLARGRSSARPGRRSGTGCGRSRGRGPRRPWRRVAQQVAAGDADVERALADVQRDVARAQVEELDAVLGVDERQLLGVLALPVAGLAQDLGRGLGQRALVRDGDAEQGHRGVPQRWA